MKNFAIALTLVCSAAAHAGPQHGYEGQQGTHVAAGNIPGKTTWSFAYDRVQVRNGGGRVAAGRLVGSTASPSVLGPYQGRFVMKRGTPWVPATLHVIAEAPHENVYDKKPYGLYEYKVTVDVQGQTGLELCPGNNRALVLPGYWLDGKFNASREEFSFACIPERTTAPMSALLEYPTTVGGGAAAKCVDWGYQPWVGPGRVPPPSGATLGGRTLPSTPEEMMQLHQACVLMATADYCGQGGVNTVDNTWIDFYNDFAIADVVTGTPAKPEPISRNLISSSKTPFAFEAAWSPSGAVCLSKKRWATLPLDLFGGGCKAGLTDPRKPKAGEVASVCDGRSEANLETSNSLLFNYSLFVDSGLYLCHGPGSNFATTTDVDVSAPATPAKFAPSLSCATFLGAVIEDRVAADILMPGVAFVPLYRHDSGGHYLTDEIAGGVLEGWLLPATASVLARPDVKPFVGPELSVWAGPSGHFLTTSATVPPPVAGYSLQKTIGRLLIIPRNP